MNFTFLKGGHKSSGPSFSVCIDSELTNTGGNNRSLECTGSYIMKLYYYMKLECTATMLYEIISRLYSEHCLPSQVLKNATLCGLNVIGLHNLMASSM